jgi:fermentation-respiration switch protein FrsA (DUF1100 family)
VEKKSMKTILTLWVFIIISSVGCSSFLYYPSKEELVDRSKLPVQPEDIYFKVDDGTPLHGWLFQHTDNSLSVKSPHDKSSLPTAVILQFHGNAQNLSTHFMQLYFCLEYNMDYFIFDYEGYGESEGSTTPKNTVRDGIAALHWLTAKYPNTPVIIVGQSLGGAVALKTLIEYQKKEPLPNIPLIMIDSSFSDYRAVARTVVSQHWLTWWLQPVAWSIIDNSQSPEEDLLQLQNKMFFVVHDKSDRVVNYSLGERLFKNLPSNKKFLALENGNHTDFFYRNKGIYRKKWIDLVHYILQHHTWPENMDKYWDL